MSPGDKRCPRSLLELLLELVIQYSVSSYHPWLGEPRACATWHTQGKSNPRNLRLGYHRCDLWRHQRVHLSAACSAAESAHGHELSRRAAHHRRPHEGRRRSKTRSRQRYNHPRNILGGHRFRVRSRRHAVSFAPCIVRRGPQAKHLTPQSSGPELASLAPAAHRGR